MDCKPYLLALRLLIQSRRSGFSETRRLDQHFEELDEDFFHGKERHHQWNKW
jgi:hypothetical protein